MQQVSFTLQCYEGNNQFTGRKFKKKRILRQIKGAKVKKSNSQEKTGCSGY